MSYVRRDETIRNVFNYAILRLQFCSEMCVLLKLVAFYCHTVLLEFWSVALLAAFMVKPVIDS